MQISVVTVTFNAAKTLEQTILSITNQTYHNIEYIIIDGASTDGTIDIINKYATKITYWISEPDKGIYDAMNKALKIAQGDFLIFMGADDIFYTSDVIEKMVGQMLNSETVYYGNVIFKGLNKKHNGKFNKIKWATTNISHQAIFYPKKIFKSYTYNTKYRIYADYAYNLTLLKDKVNFKYINEIITLYSMEGISANSKDKIFQEDYKKLLTDSIGISAYYIGTCIRYLYHIKIWLFNLIKIYKKH